MALKVKVKKTVTLDIDIDQVGLEKLVRDHIAAEDPNIVVKAVKFVATRKPAGVVVEVEAEYRDDDEADDVKADVCKGCGEAVCECKSDTGEAEKEEDAPDPEPEAEEQLELEETEPEATSEESFEDSEMDLIDETLAEHADEEDAAAMDLPDVDTDLPDGMDDLPDVDAEPAPKKRKSLFNKD
ncbi:hypothetical protein SBP1_gp045 [Vibrio virus vB_VspP_SBP1]|uniref:Uncharacterized protein n=1 Tax=Vibrio virus vB_VspP_SBP1 TaxID=2500581 RepID=A0A3T0IIH9_9CAUD|nr:hypothetical protein KNU36_gp084 [Vibrio virus vB_VspP_SBP1]AZU99637.1 hypothetical protein SBP1_gp045 [Vibrio virus vB_VspP_SBP1]